MGNTHQGTLKRKRNYDEYTIMLVGRMGAGKSSLGNFLLKEDHFKASNSMGRVTDKNMCQCTNLPGDITLRIIDTPGLGDFRESEEVKRDLAEAFYEAKDGVDAFLFVISAAERVGKDMVEQFEKFREYIDHEHFYDYMIPVFTKVDTRLKSNDQNDIHSYEKQERLIHEELKDEQLEVFNDRIIKQANKNWMCISSNARDDFYYKHIIDKLIGTIENIRRKREGMVCTSHIMEKAKERTDTERDKNKEAQEEEIKKLVIAFLLRILIDELQGEDFDNVFGDETQRRKKDAENEKDKQPNTSKSSQTGETGTPEDLKPRSSDLEVQPP